MHHGVIYFYIYISRHSMMNHNKTVTTFTHITLTFWNMASWNSLSSLSIVSHVPSGTSHTEDPFGSSTWFAKGYSGRYRSGTYWIKMLIMTGIIKKIFSNCLFDSTLTSRSLVVLFSITPKLVYPTENCLLVTIKLKSLRFVDT